MCCLMTLRFVVGCIEISGPMRAVPSEVMGVTVCPSMCPAVHIPITSADYIVLDHISVICDCKN